ncbi:MAG: M48 family metalloprotease [Planctomycetota bacterium]
MTKTTNLVKAGLILLFVLLAFITLGSLVGFLGIYYGLGVGILSNLLILFVGDKVFIAAMSGVKADKREYAELIKLVGGLADQAGLPGPEIVICPQKVPNAFSLGWSPKRSTIGLTQGAIDQLNLDELAGVIGHELAHIRNRDTLLSSIVATSAGMVSNVSIISLRGRGIGWGLQHLVMISVPFSAALVRLCIRRKREFIADKEGASIAGSVEGLISALIKMQAIAEQTVMASMPINDHLMTVGPPPGDWLSALFSTHPSVQERVDRLQHYAKPERPGFGAAQ